MSRIIIILICIAVSLPAVWSERRQTTRRNLHVRCDSVEGAGEEIWVKPDSGWQPIRFCGYEKKQSANKETLFIVNLTDTTFSLMRFTISYLDSSKREIHRRCVEHPIELPPCETRRIDFRSWDTQNSYYYINGPGPRRSATPYDITVSLDSILCTTANAPD